MSDDPSNRRKLGANRNWTRSAGGDGGGGFLSLEIVAISKNESTWTRLSEGESPSYHFSEEITDGRTDGRLQVSQNPLATVAIVNKHQDMISFFSLHYSLYMDQGFLLYK